MTTDRPYREALPHRRGPCATRGGGGDAVRPARRRGVPPRPRPRRPGLLSRRAAARSARGQSRSRRRAQRASCRWRQLGLGGRSAGALARDRGWLRRHEEFRRLGAGGRSLQAFRDHGRRGRGGGEAAFGVRSATRSFSRRLDMIDHTGTDRQRLRQEQGVLCQGARAARLQGDDGVPAEQTGRRLPPGSATPSPISGCRGPAARRPASTSPSPPRAAPPSTRSTRRRWRRADATTGRRARRALSPHYYGAFVLDPDGHNIEAVCHYPPGGAAKPKAAAKQAGAARARARNPPRKKPAQKRREAEEAVIDHANSCQSPTIRGAKPSMPRRWRRSVSR